MLLRSLVLGGEPRFWQRFYFWPPFLPGDERSGGHRGRLESDGGSESLALRGWEAALGEDYPGTDLREKRNRIAFTVLCKGEQQRTLMLTDEYRRLPSLPSSLFGRITVPVFLLFDFSWFPPPPLIVTPFRVETIKKPGSLTSPNWPNAIITSQKV